MTMNLSAFIPPVTEIGASVYSRQKDITRISERILDIEHVHLREITYRSFLLGLGFGLG